MARKLRLEFPGACYHVINRGNYRRNVFAPKGAAEAFVRCLSETAERYCWRVHAFVVMRNHFHLAVETPEPNLSQGMKWLQGTWAMRLNRYWGEMGRPFQGRYKALHVEPGDAFVQVCHYIHLNPVRARVLSVGQVFEYPQSSLAWFLRKDRPKWLVAATVLVGSGGLVDSPTGWRKYREYLEFLAEEDLKLRDERFGRMSRGWMLGSQDFKRVLQQDLVGQGAELEKLQLLGIGPVSEVREEQWERKLQRAAKNLQIDLQQLPRNKSAPDKVRLAALMKAGTAVSNRWLAERLLMGQPASVSQFVRRFRLQGLDGTPEFAAVLSTVKT